MFLIDGHMIFPVSAQLQEYQRWLNRDIRDIEFPKTLLQPCSADAMMAYPVVNRSEELLEMIGKIEFGVPGAKELMKAAKPITVKRPKQR